jgi:hypothetical protein
MKRRFINFLAAIAIAAMPFLSLVFLTQGAYATSSVSPTSNTSSVHPSGNTTTVSPSTSSSGGTSTSSGSGGGNTSGAGAHSSGVSVTTGVVSHGAGGSAGECYAGDTKITFAILPIEGNHVDCKDAIFQALGIGLSILTWGVSIGATIGFVITAYQYITAGSNVAQVQKAKMRMVQIVIGIVFYATFWGVMNWLLPGGLFGDGSI